VDIEEDMIDAVREFVELFFQTRCVLMEGIEMSAPVVREVTEGFVVKECACYLF
jgi:hypothetical protein